ncbi:hypothetical protein R69746_04774 [Paraburkholderia aspalathi]|uniref:hypothetical protein n=1 Tax=Paraburkholderia aspalathi TaxID=1324617 RepID=UPI00190DE14F|nr:hypothetical protein [Paraburkholderia aspalathi]MBK3840798.1 hypothetical protein [Paraburkholderia aspalathi]CAE6791950.1 hypothetical protein R69746_04774 [Paraburkholderia aspalathi]
MDFLTFTSKALEALAWPTVVLILGLVFRQKLLDLIPAIKKIKAGPVEAEFEFAAKTVLAEAAEVVSPANSSELAGPLAPTSEPGRGLITKLRNARTDATGAIIEGWATLDGELFRLAQQFGLDGTEAPTTNTTKVYQAVMSSNVLPNETRRLVHELREMRNKVAHNSVVPTADSAQDYLLAVDRVVELIRNHRKNLPNYGPGSR